MLAPLFPFLIISLIQHGSRLKIFRRGEATDTLKSRDLRRRQAERAARQSVEELKEQSLEAWCRTGAF